MAEVSIPEEIPNDVVHAAWHEYVYPLTAVERPMTPGFERAMRVINEWLAGRASVLRGEAADCSKCLRPVREHTTDECPPPL